MRICPRCRAQYTGEEVFCMKDKRPLVDEKDFGRVGQTIGNYKILDVLGRGGMGTVYKGEHVYIGRAVAVKILHERFARYEDAVKRFLREARAASSINHPNIVEVTDFGPLPDSGVFFVMEYLAGESLEDFIEREAPVPLHRTISIIDQMASALAAAHEKGIVHRDLKPENVMLTRRPGRRELVRTETDAGGSLRLVVEHEETYDFVKILDFGIAKVREPDGLGESFPSSTAAGTIIGTPEYMSPEAARGQAVDLRADIYSLGVIFYDMLVGAPPFHGGSPVEILSRHITEDPEPPRSANPEAEITEPAETLILRALAKDPAERQQTIEELRDELKHCFGRIVYRRDADSVPNLKAAGISPRPKRLTDELDEWLSINKGQMSAAKQRLEAIVEEPEKVASVAVPLREDGTESSPVLLTRKKPKDE